jgi:hypothetical protein
MGLVAGGPVFIHRFLYINQVLKSQIAGLSYVVRKEGSGVKELPGSVIIKLKPVQGVSTVQVVQ